jgi:uncharacterized protein YqfA (UPF0365 family)
MNAPAPLDGSSLVVGFGLGFVCAISLLVVFAPFLWVFATWMRCFLTGGRVSLVQIIGMLLRRSPVSLIVDAHHALIQGGRASRVQLVEQTYIANRHRIQTLGDLIELSTKALDETEKAK